MPETITWGHVLMLAGLLVGLFALLNLLRWLRQRDFTRGTPQYADGRLARRAALYGMAIAIVLFAGGGLTPLCELPIA
ncbi:MAG TPA: hypothetical protein VFO69_09740 [Allosphingosinicella sp.]|nr:hypothetical protein [Allosphingosinicella sp.]